MEWENLVHFNPIFHNTHPPNPYYDSSIQNKHIAKFDNSMYIGWVHLILITIIFWDVGFFYLFIEDYKWLGRFM